MRRFSFSADVATLSQLSDESSLAQSDFPAGFLSVHSQDTGWLSVTSIAGSEPRGRSNDAIDTSATLAGLAGSLRNGFFRHVRSFYQGVFRFREIGGQTPN